jgi:hypothetical protein
MAVQILALQQRATANDANGNPLAGAKIYTYETGTTTPLATFTTSALSVANPNPIIADAAGRYGPIYTDGAVAVKVVITTAADVTVDTLDPSPFAYDSQSGASQISATPNALLTANNVQGALDQVTTRLLTQASFFATAGGTANAITLITGLNLPALVAGMRVTFIPTAANTGATTINVDGIGAVACRTITNVALPANYILTSFGVRTAVYTGTSWIVDYPTTRGSNANGSWTRYADGTQICFSTVVTSSGTVTWTFPIAFGGMPTISLGPNSNEDRGATHTDKSTTSVVIRGWRTVGTDWDGNIDVTATGRWY